MAFLSLAHVDTQTAMDPWQCLGSRCVTYKPHSTAAGRPLAALALNAVSVYVCRQQQLLMPALTTLAAVVAAMRCGASLAWFWASGDVCARGLHRSMQSIPCIHTQRSAHSHACVRMHNKRKHTQTQPHNASLVQQYSIVLRRTSTSACWSGNNGQPIQIQRGYYEGDRWRCVCLYHTTNLNLH